MKRLLAIAALLLGLVSIQADAQMQAPLSSSGGGAGSGGSSNNCTANSSPSDVLFNSAGTCAGNAGLTYNGTDQLRANNTGSAIITAIPNAKVVLQGNGGATPDVTNPKIGVQGFTSGTAGGEPAFAIAAANGTAASPAALTDALLGSAMLGYGYDGTSWNLGARIDFWNDSAAGWTPSDHGTGVCIGTTGIGSTVVGTDDLCINHNGGVVVGASAYGGLVQGFGTVNTQGYWLNNYPFATNSLTNTANTVLTQTYTNDTVTGTAAGKVVKLNSSGKVLTVTTADTTDGIGICVASITGTGCTNSGNASIAWAGYAQCFFDGSTTAGDWVIISTSVAGDCSDGGTGTPSNVEILGTVVTTNVGAGLYTISLNPVGVAAATSKKAGGGGAPTTCALSGNYACRNLPASWSAGQRSTPVAVTLSTSTFTPNMDSSDNFSFTLVHASCPCQIANPSNLTAGQTGVFIITQSATGGDTVTWGGNYVFPNGTPTLQTTASAEDYFSFYAESSSRIVIVPASGAYGAVQQVVNYNTEAPPTFPSETGFAVNGANTDVARLAASTYAAAAHFTGMRADGTGASPSAVQSGEEIASFNAFPFNGSAYVGPTAAFRSYAAENIAVGHQGSKGCIATTPIASTTLADQFCVNNDGSATLTGLPLTAGISQPQGRLTLVSGSPVMTSDQTAKSQIFYDCYIGKTVSYFNGTNDLGDSISSCEVSLTMQTTGTGVTNSGGVFDIWWVHSGANRVCVATNGSGGGWASDTGGSNTARGTGYSQVHNTRGYWTNVNAITHCYNGATDYGSISADQATYLGTITTTAAGQTGVALKPSAASGGTNNFVGLFNAYNRVPITAVSRDSTSSWNYASATWRQTDSSNSNRISFVDGLQVVNLIANSSVNIVFSATNCFGATGANLDATTGQPNIIAQINTNSASIATTVMSKENYYPVIGLHFIQGMESAGGGTCTFFGSPYQTVSLEMEM